MKRKIISFLFLFIILTSFTGCNITNKIIGIKVPTKITLNINEMKIIHPYYAFKNNIDKKDYEKIISNIKPTYISENPDIVKVDENGILNSVKSGTTRIFIEVENVKQSISVTILPPISSILTKKKIEIEAGKGQNIELSVNPSIASKDNISYTSEDPSIVIVNKYGRISALKEGETKILITGGEAITEIKVIVKPRIDKIIIREGKDERYSGEMNKWRYKTLTAFTDPEIKDVNFIWTSSDNDLATVTNGKIRTLGKTGEVTITAYVRGYEVVAEYTLIIK